MTQTSGRRHRCAIESRDRALVARNEGGGGRELECHVRRAGHEVGGHGACSLEVLDLDRIEILSTRNDKRRRIQVDLMITYP